MAIQHIITDIDTIIAHIADQNNKNNVDYVTHLQNVRKYLQILQNKYFLGGVVNDILKVNKGDYTNNQEYINAIVNEIIIKGQAFYNYNFYLELLLNSFIVAAFAAAAVAAAFFMLAFSGPVGALAIPFLFCAAVAFLKSFIYIEDLCHDNFSILYNIEQYAKNPTYSTETIIASTGCMNTTISSTN